MNLAYLNELDKRVEAKLLRRVVSKCGTMVLYNYTDKCVYDKMWDRYTLNNRGNVYCSKTGKLLAKSFPKFFNFGEHCAEKQEEILLSNSYTVHEKLDGSLGIVFSYKGQLVVNTRGSFESDQAAMAREILNINNQANSLNDFLSRTASSFCNGVTLLFEIIHPQNRIVCDYGDEKKMVLLGGYHTGSKEVVHDSILNGIALAFNFQRPNTYKFNSLKEVFQKIQKMPWTEEGYVVQLENGERVKFKSVEYLRVSSILSNLTPLTLWRNMENGLVKKDFLMTLPEEFRSEVDKLSKYLENLYCDTESEIFDQYGKYRVKVENSLIKEGKDVVENFKAAFGKLIQKEKPKHWKAFFPILLDRSIDEYVMKYIRPKGNETEGDL